MRELPGRRFSLTMPIRIQPDVDLASGQYAVDQIVRGMTDEIKRGHDVSLPVACQLTFSPSMKASVRSRASPSVNCCGGDFMK